MEKNGVESRLSTTERTISSVLLLLLACRSRNDSVECCSNRAVNSRQTLLHYSISPLFLLALTWIVFVHQSRAAETKFWEGFSGEKALAHVQRLVDLGPHPAGSDAIEKARAYIEEQLRHSGWQITRQAFTDDTPRGKIHFVNLIARFPGDANPASPSFLLC